MNWFGFVSGAILAILTMKVAVAGPPGAPGVAPIEVVVLGTFHFDNPGLDYASVQVDDVLAPTRQAQIGEAADSGDNTKMTVSASRIISCRRACHSSP